MATLMDLHEQITAAGIPISSVVLQSESPLVVFIRFEDSATPEQRAAAQGMLDTWAQQTPQQRKTTNRIALINAARNLNGVALTDLTAVQQRQLLALLLYKAGWIAPNLTISIPQLNE